MDDEILKMLWFMYQIFLPSQHVVLSFAGSYGLNLRRNADIFLSADGGLSWHMVGIGMTLLYLFLVVI